MSEAAAPGGSRRARPRRRQSGLGLEGIAALTSGLFVVALPLVVLVVVVHGPEVGLSTQWLLLLVLFAAADRMVAHLPTSQGAHSFTLREIPAVLGLALLEPTGYVIAYVVGAAAMAVLLRQSAMKLVFNVGLFLLEASAGVLVFHLLLAGGEVTEPRGWLAAMIAVLTTDLMSAMAVTAAIRVSEGRSPSALFNVPEWVRTGLLAALINTSVAILLLVLLEVRPLALLVLAFTSAVVLYGYRQYVSLVDGYARLQTLYRFVGSTGKAAELDDALESVLAEASMLLRAERAELVMLGQSGTAGTIFTSSSRGGFSSRVLRDAELGTSWWSTAVSGTPVLLPSDAKEGRPLGSPRDGIAVPLESEVFHGVLLVADRTFERETYGERDLQLFETLGAHAAVTLEKARLVDRLRRVAAEREHDALHDALTGLPNRRAFNEAVARTLSAGTGGAVLLMDLDDFKDVNDTLGHRAGDELLQVTGRRLRAMVVEEGRSAPAPGTVARLGGDEFAVLLPGVGSDEAVVRARELLESVIAPVPIQDITLTTTASIGVAPIPLDARDSDELLVQADVAMYAAKAAGTGVAPYVAEDTDAVHRRLALAGELPSAIERRGFEVWCQPQTDARTGAVTGVEALLRWWHPSYGWVPPTEVVAIAERTGVLGRLTLAVLAESLRMRADWVRAGHELDISVNVTARDMSDLSFPDAVGALLAATGTAPDALVLEITESGVMSDPERSMEVLAALRRLGVGVSVDDFGTGHSSLAYLERLPVNEVKIDQSFVKRLELEATDSTVVRSIVLLAHDLGMRVVAEGVESDVARQRVQALGCELVQGFVVARPMPGDQVPGWLGARTADALPG